MSMGGRVADSIASRGARADPTIVLAWSSGVPLTVFEEDVEVVDCRRRYQVMTSRSGTKPVHPEKILRNERDESETSVRAPAEMPSVPNDRMTAILDGR